MQKKYDLVKCADGFSMSVQAGKGSYCSPRDDSGPYDSVEVGFPSSYDYYLHEYAEEFLLQALHELIRASHFFL